MSRIGQARAAAVIVAATACGPPAQSPREHEARAETVRLPQGVRPGITVEVTGPRGAFDEAAVQAARELIVAVAGPEPSKRSYLLEVPKQRACPRDRECTYYSMPFGIQTLELGRYTRLGVYTLTVASPAGLTVEVTPARFEIVAGPAVELAALTRTRLGYDRYTGSGAVTGHRGGIVVANVAGEALYIDGPGKRRALEIDGDDATIASSDVGIAVGTTARDGTPTVSLIDPALRDVRVVALGPKRSSQYSLLGWKPPVEVSWDPTRSEWVAAWISSEKPTRADVASRSRRGEMIPWASSVVRFARVSPSGTLIRSLRLGEAEHVSNVVWNGSEHAFVALKWLVAGRWKMTLVRIRDGQVAGRTVIAGRAACPRLRRRAVQLAWDETSYVALLLESDGDVFADDREVPRLSAGRIGDEPAPLVELAVAPETDIASARLEIHDGQRWLVYAARERTFGRTLVYAAILDQTLGIEKALVVDDGYDDVLDLRLVKDGGRLKSAVFREQQSWMIGLPEASRMRSLPGVATASLYQPTECLPSPQNPGR